MRELFRKSIQESLSLDQEGLGVFLQLDDRILKVVEMYHTPAAVLERWKSSGVSDTEIAQRDAYMCLARKSARELERRQTLKYIGSMDVS